MKNNNVHLVDVGMSKWCRYTDTFSKKYPSTSSNEKLLVDKKEQVYFPNLNFFWEKQMYEKRFATSYFFVKMVHILRSNNQYFLIFLKKTQFLIILKEFCE